MSQLGVVAMEFVVTYEMQQLKQVTLEGQQKKYRCTIRSHGAGGVVVLLWGEVNKAK